jgi:hypothetical protein
MVTKADSKIEMIQVSSSNIHAIGYDPERKTLVVRFAAGKTYEYQNVTAEIYKQLTQSGSVGSAFNELIRSNPHQYPYKSV